MTTIEEQTLATAILDRAPMTRLHQIDALTADATLLISPIGLAFADAMTSVSGESWVYRGHSAVRYGTASAPYVQVFVSGHNEAFACLECATDGSVTYTLFSESEKKKHTSCSDGPVVDAMIKFLRDAVR